MKIGNLIQVLLSIWVFFLLIFFAKVTLRADSLETLPCHVDFTPISSIAQFLNVFLKFYFLTPKILKNYFSFGGGSR